MALADELKAELESPVDISGIGNVFKKDKILVVIIYEDGSYLKFKRKLTKEYFIEVKGRFYMLVPECILRGKNPMIMFYFNNPCPINYRFEYTKISKDIMQNPDKIKDANKKRLQVLEPTTYIDAKALHSAFSSQIMKGLYASNMFTAKQVIIFILLGLVAVLVLLQLTGTVDIVGNLSKVATG